MNKLFVNNNKKKISKKSKKSKKYYCTGGSNNSNIKFIKQGDICVHGNNKTHKGSIKLGEADNNIVPLICKKSLKKLIKKDKKRKSTLSSNKQKLCYNEYCWHRLSAKNKLFKKNKFKNVLKKKSMIMQNLEKSAKEIKHKTTKTNTKIEKKIDDINFELINYNPTSHNNRGLVKIKSTYSDEKQEKNFTFFVYRSHSELGFWRFAYYDQSIGQLCKLNEPRYGEIEPDYIQTTFIDLRLQQFINESLNIYL